ncbi:MAG: ImmA/IrrE family metallo-endopeptidase [Solirubrobacteraceae bacterium]
MSGQVPPQLERAIAAEEAANRELARIPEWIWDGETLPVPIEAICDSHYGLLIEEHHRLAEAAGTPPDIHLSGLLFSDAREVWVNAGEAPVRRRFTVGHELGHWVLHCAHGHRSAGAVVHCRGSEVREEAAAGMDHIERYLDYPPDELDANQFAAALLMPARLLAAWTRSSSGEENLSRAFAVSPAAMSRRRWFLSTLGAGGAGGD